MDTIQIVLFVCLNIIFPLHNRLADQLMKVIEFVSVLLS